MPRKLRAGKQRTRITLDDLGFEDILGFLCAWHPPDTDLGREQDRWQTWEQFDEEYALLRGELLQHEWAQNSLKRGESVFAEERWQALQRGEEPPTRRGE